MSHSSRRSSRRYSSSTAPGIRWLTMIDTYRPEMTNNFSNLNASPGNGTSKVLKIRRGPGKADRVFAANGHARSDNLLRFAAKQQDGVINQKTPHPSLPARRSACGRHLSSAESRDTFLQQLRFRHSSCHPAPSRSDASRLCGSTQERLNRLKMRAAAEPAANRTAASELWLCPVASQ